MTEEIATRVLHRFHQRRSIIYKVAPLFLVVEIYWFFNIFFVFVRFTHIVGMVRKYQRKVGSRKYQDYTKEQLEAALIEVRKGNSLRKVVEMSKIPFSTLAKRNRRLH